MALTRVSGNLIVSGVTLTSPAITGNLTLSGGTVNGVTFLNGSKVLTSGSDLAFSGTTLTLKNGYYEAYDPVDSTSAGYGMRFYTDGGGTKTENGRLVVAQTATSGSLSSMIFQTNNGTSLSEQMRLTSTGLGIGTSSPQSRLHVSDSVAGGQLLVTNNETNNGAKIGSLATMHHQNAEEPVLAISIEGGASENILQIGGGPGEFNAATVIKFSTAANTTTTGGTERARIDSSGNLLVGTTSQFLSEKLSVVTGNTVGVGVKTTGGASDATVGCWNATTSGNSNFIFFATESSITVRGNIDYNRAAGLVSYNTTSDYRAKDISGPVTNSGALIDSIPVYMGKMKWATQERPMFIAHEVPTYAHTGTKDAVDADGNPVYQQMDASALIPVMWAEIQSLRQRLSAANL